MEPHEIRNLFLLDCNYRIPNTGRVENNYQEFIHKFKSFEHTKK
jgi:hypothetical protein